MQEALEKERLRQKERQRKVLQRFRELVRRKGALEAEIERILGVVRAGVCEVFEAVSASREGDMPEQEEEEREEERLVD